MKLTPTMKLIGSLIVSLFKRLTLLFCALFCIPIISNKNKEKLNKVEKINFLYTTNINCRYSYLNINTNYKLCFFLSFSSWLNILMLQKVLNLHLLDHEALFLNMIYQILDLCFLKIRL